MPTLYKKKSSPLQYFKEAVQGFRTGLTKSIFKKELEYSSGSEIEEHNPAQLLQDKGDLEMKLYDAMLLDDRVSLAIELKKRLASSVKADIYPASEDDKDVEIATEIENQLKVKGESYYNHTPGFSFWSSIESMLDACAYGYKVAEKIWAIENGKIVLKNLKFKHSKYYDFNYDEYANFNELIIGKNYGTIAKLEGSENVYQKFLICVYPYVKDGNYYGESDLMRIYEKYRSKLHLQRQRNSTLEKFGTPIPEAKYDAAKMKASEKQSLEDLLTNFQDGKFFMTPSTRNPKTGELLPKIEFSVHNMQTSDIGDSFNKAIDQIDKQITRALLFPDKLGFSESPGGSYNQSETQLDLLQLTIEHTHQWLETIINNQLIKPIVDMNYSGVKEYPCFKFDKVSEKIKADMLEKLINLKVVDPKESWIRQHVGIPVLTEEEQEAIKEENEKNRPTINEPGNNDNNDDNDIDDKKEFKYTEPQANKRMTIFKRKGNPFKGRETKTWMNTQEDEFVTEYTRLMKKNIDAVAKQIDKKNIISEKNVKAKDTLRIPKKELNEYLTNKFSQWYFTGKKLAAEETKPRFPKNTQFKKISYNTEGMTTINGELQHAHEYIVDDNGNGSTKNTTGEAKDHVHEIISFQVMPASDHEHSIPQTFKQNNFKVEWLDREFIDRFLGEDTTLTKADREYLTILKERSFTITGIEEGKVLKETKMIIDQGIRSGETAADVIQKVRLTLYDDVKKYATTIVRTNMSDQYNTGRLNFFTDPDVRPMIEAYQYQAIIDDATTVFCREHDGQVIKATDSGKVAQMNPPAHHNCRSVLVPILIGDDTDPDSFFYKYESETQPFGTNVSEPLPAKGFGG